MSFIKRELPVIIAFSIGVLTTIQYFLVDTTLNTVVSYFTSWAVVIWAFMMAMGIINLLIRNVHVARTKRAGQWYFSIILIAVLVIMSMVGILGTTNHPVYAFLFNNVQVPLEVTARSLLAFYIVTASYRAFKLRSLESSILLICAIVVMLGNIPVGELLGNNFLDARNWLMNVPNIGGTRGIGIGMALGTIALAIRSWLGYEKAALGMGGEE
jgi:hypothetical protein